MNNEARDMKPKPGSHEAIRRGCICPRIDNGWGKGRGGDGERFGWIVASDCPLHGSF